MKLIKQIKEGESIDSAVIGFKFHSKHYWFISFTNPFTGRFYRFGNFYERNLSPIQGQLTMLYRYATSIPCPLCKGKMRVMRQNHTSPNGMSGMFMLRCKEHGYFEMEVRLLGRGDVPPPDFRKS